MIILESEQVSYNDLLWSVKVEQEKIRWPTAIRVKTHASDVQTSDPICMCAWVMSTGPGIMNTI